MQVIPAIDLKNGRCVRLEQGRFENEKIYSGDPVAVAQGYQQHGATRLHIVDLDGAESGEAGNSAVVEEILSCCRMAVQLGGGIRMISHVEHWLNAGVERVIIGTLAVRQPQEAARALASFGGERIVLSVDARDGMVAVDGWQTDSGISAIDLTLQFKQKGLERVLYTDIARDGMFSGPNLVETRKIAEESGLRVTASGGVARLSDIRDLAALEAFGVDSVVVGKAFYEGRIKPEEVFDAG